MHTPSTCAGMRNQLLIVLSYYACRQRILIVARAIGRFEIKRIVTDKPFVAAMVQDMADAPPTTFQQAADISTAATQLWQCMQQVKDLAGKLYSHAGPIGETCTMHLAVLLA